LGPPGGWLLVGLPGRCRWPRPTRARFGRGKAFSRLGLKRRKFKSRICSSFSLTIKARLAFSACRTWKAWRVNARDWSRAASYALEQLQQRRQFRAPEAAADVQHHEGSNLQAQTEFTRQPEYPTLPPTSLREGLLRHSLQARRRDPEAVPPALQMNALTKLRRISRLNSLWCSVQICVF